MGFLAKTFGFGGLDAAPSDAPTGDYSANVQPPARRPESMTLERAITLISVFRGIQIIAGIGAQLTINAVRRGEIVEPTPSILIQPDPWRTLDSWIERYIVSMIADGNVFMRKHYGPADSKGARALVSLEILNPFLVQVRWKKGVKSYHHTPAHGLPSETLTAADVIHVMFLELPGRDRGIGPLQAGASELAGALDIRDYAAGWFQESDVPSGVLSSDQALDPAAVKMYRQVWADPAAFDDEETKRKRIGPSVRVLGKGLSYDALRLDPEAAQWLPGQRWKVLEVARLLGLPGDYLLAAVEGKSMTYQNLEMIDGQFIKITLFPAYLRKLQGALTSVLVHGQSAVFATGDFVKPDSKTQAEIDKVYTEIGVYDAAFVRRRLGIPGAPPPKPKPVAAPAPAPEEDSE